MTLVNYDFEISTDFTNHKVATDRLAIEIQQSAITIALDRIDTSGDICSIWFKNTLPQSDENALHGLVLAHSGEPLPSEAMAVSLNKDTSSVQVAVIANSGWSPDPSSYPNGTLPSNIDCIGNQQIRGQVLTDEGCFRDDFPGTSMFRLIPGTMKFTNGSTSVTGINTTFRTSLSTDDYIYFQLDDENISVRINTILSDTNLILEDNYTGAGGIGDGYASKWMVNDDKDGYSTINDSKITLFSGLQQMSYSAISRWVDFEPLRMGSILSVSGREENTRIAVGFTDRLIGPTYNDWATIMFEGTDNTKVTFTTGCDGKEEASEVTLPAGQTTDNEQYYEIIITGIGNALLINGKLVANHKRHIPKMYTTLMVGAGIWNMEAIQTQVSITLENFMTFNHDRIQIGGDFLESKPLATRLIEDSHTITGKLITTSTSNDQIIIQYTIPEDSVMFATGYYISAPDNSVGANPFKIGRGNISIEPTAPGVIDGSILRIGRIQSGSSKDEDWSASPRLLGSAGDVIYITVTPDGEISSDWYATLDFVLR